MANVIDCEPSTSAMFAKPALHRCQCGKARYTSHDAAERSIKALKRSGKDRKYQGYLHPYICPIGRVWHVGHTEYED